VRCARRGSSAEVLHPGCARPGRGSIRTHSPSVCCAKLGVQRCQSKTVRRKPTAPDPGRARHAAEDLSTLRGLLAPPPRQSLTARGLCDSMASGPAQPARLQSCAMQAASALRSAASPPQLHKATRRPFVAASAAPPYNVVITGSTKGPPPPPLPTPLSTVHDGGRRRVNILQRTYHGPAWRSERRLS